MEPQTAAIITSVVLVVLLILGAIAWAVSDDGFANLTRNDPKP